MKTLAPRDPDDDDDLDESVEEHQNDFIFGHLEKALKREGNGSGAIVEKQQRNDASKNRQNEKAPPSESRKDLALTKLMETKLKAIYTL